MPRAHRDIECHERLWGENAVDRNLNDAWLQRLNNLTCFDLISICEGHFNRPRNSSSPFPHLNLRLKPRLVPAIINRWQSVKVQFEHLLYQIFPNGGTRVEVVYSSRTVIPSSMPHSRPDDLLIRIECRQRRESQSFETWVLNWFETTVGKAAQIDRVFHSVIGVPRLVRCSRQRQCHRGQFPTQG